MLVAACVLDVFLCYNRVDPSQLKSGRWPLNTFLTV